MVQWLCGSYKGLLIKVSYTEIFLHSLSSFLTTLREFCDTDLHFFFQVWHFNIEPYQTCLGIFNIHKLKMYHSSF